MRIEQINTQDFRGHTNVVNVFQTMDKYVMLRRSNCGFHKISAFILRQEKAKSIPLMVQVHFIYLFKHLFVRLNAFLHLIQSAEFSAILDH